MYNRAIAYRPNYVHALIGLAKIQEQKKNITAAITTTEKAINILSESSFVSYLAYLTDLKGDDVKAKEINADVVKLIEETEKENKLEKLIPHNGNREMAQAYLQNNQLEKALVFAMNDYKLRPNNVDANELVANIYFLANDATAAKPYALKAMSTGKKNRQALELFVKIFKASNDNATASKTETLISNIKSLKL
jgi:tetratricopeptide (TPR) repeat protein